MLWLIMFYIKLPLLELLCCVCILFGPTQYRISIENGARKITSQRSDVEICLAALLDWKTGLNYLPMGNGVLVMHGMQ